MSDTKHTPLPLEIGYGEKGLTGPKTPSGSGPTCLESTETYEHNRQVELGNSPAPLGMWHTVIRKGAETIAIIPGDKDERDAYAQLFVTSVNARPKVEELVKAGKSIVTEFLEMSSGIEDTPYNVQRLETAIREVEAALGGKAE